MTNANRDITVATGLGLAALFVYVKTLCPTVYFGDSGEIASAITLGGIIHPPGYPLFGLLGRIALRLIPIGEPAFRIGCVVAAAAAATVAVLYLCGRTLGAARLPAAAAAAFFGLSFSFWNQSVRVEVYSLHTLLCALAFLFALRFHRRERTVDAVLAAGSLGLGLAHHVTIIVLLPSLLLLVGTRFWTVRRVAASVGAGLIGPSLYGLLPLWASANPAHNWGDIHSLKTLTVHVSARIFQGQLQWPTLHAWPNRLGKAGHGLTDNLPFGLFLLAAAGAAICWHRDRRVALGIGSGAAVVAVFNCCYAIPDIAGYYLPVWLCLVLFVAVAADAFWLRARARPILAAGLLLCLPGTQLARNIGACDLSRVTFVRRLAADKLDSCAPNAVYISFGDQDTNPIWYVQEVLGKRTDVLHINQMLLHQFGYGDAGDIWYLREMELKNVDLRPFHTWTAADWRAMPTDDVLIRLVSGPLARRPLHTSFVADRASARKRGPFPIWLAARRVAVPQGLTFRYYSPGAIPSKSVLIAESARFWDRATLPSLGPIRFDEEMDPNYLSDYYTTFLINYGGLFEIDGDPARAAAIYRAALDFAPNDPKARRAVASLR